MSAATTETMPGLGETTVPVLPCISPEATITFYEALRFVVTYKMTRPYLYLALRRGDIELHFGKGPATLDPSEEMSGGCLVMVDAVELYHRAFTDALRVAYGKVLSAGRPRITRFRPGQTRFTIVDPAGNSLIFIQRDEPEELEYGGSKSLEGLPRILDNVRIFRDFKSDDAMAAKVLDGALKRYRSTAAAIDVARALAVRCELAVALNDVDRARALREELRSLSLSDDEHAGLAEELQIIGNLEAWLSGRAK